MKDSTGKAVKAGLGYAIGNILIKGIGFLSIPVFSRLMTTKEFGIYNVFLSYESFLYVLIGVAIHSSIRSANLEFKKKINEYTSSVTLIYIINLFLFSLMAGIFYRPISNALGIETPVLFFLIFYSFSSALLALYNNRISLDYAYKKYLHVALFNSVGNVLLSFVLIFTVFKSHREYGRIAGSTIILCIIAVYILLDFYKKAKPAENKDYWKFALKYSLPIVPHGISQTILSTFDRIMINRMVGSSEAGIYSLATNIQLILTVLIDSVMNSLNTWYYERLDEGDKDEIVRRSIQVVTLFLILSIGLMSLAPEIVKILGGAKFDKAKFAAIPMIMSSFLIMIYNIVVIVEYYTKRTKYIMFMTMFAAILNIITNYYFILKFGFIAAAYTTLFSYFIYLILHTYISYKFIGYYIIPIKYMAFFIIFICVAAIIDIFFIDSIFVNVI